MRLDQNQQWKLCRTERYNPFERVSDHLGYASHGLRADSCCMMATAQDALDSIFDADALLNEAQFIEQTRDQPAAGVLDCGPGASSYPDGHEACAP